MGGILICSAWEPEQSKLRARLVERPLAPEILSPWGGPVEFFLCGVGVFAALESLSVRFARSSEYELPRLLVFVGTAGAEREAVRSDVILPFADVVHEVCWVDVAVSEKKSYVPEVMGRRALIQGTDTPESTLPGVSRVQVPQGPTLHPARCVTRYGISKTVSRSLEDGCYENLELYGFARAAQNWKIPWCGFLGISNWIGPDAHREWSAHHLDASERAQNLCYAALFGGGSSSN